MGGHVQLAKLLDILEVVLLVELHLLVVDKDCKTWQGSAIFFLSILQGLCESMIFFCLLPIAWIDYGAGLGVQLSSAINQQSTNANYDMYTIEMGKVLQMIF